VGSFVFLAPASASPKLPNHLQSGGELTNQQYSSEEAHLARPHESPYEVLYSVNTTAFVVVVPIVVNEARNNSIKTMVASMITPMPYPLNSMRPILMLPMD
jgi:hypothetical protein